MPPNSFTVFSIASFTLFSSLTSHWIGKQRPPAFFIYSAALNIVPSNLGCDSTVLAAIAIFAPSCAARKAIASPIPLDAPVIKSVLFLREPAD